jgi:hypothetical protein
MEAKHTQGELHIDRHGHIYGPAVETDDPEILKTLSVGGKPHIATVQGKGARPGDGARLVACWNACQSIPTEALEAGVVGELVEACRTLVDSSLPAWPGRSAIEIAHKALTKAKGGE